MRDAAFPFAPGRGALSAALTSFVGREHELAEVARLLSETRLLTLTGAGGVGKTRLALALADRARPAFPAGVCWVDLAAVADAALVPQAVATALGVREQPGRSVLDAITAATATRRLLLALDNGEHLVDACARLADGLLRAGPDLRVLVTSREALGIAGETTWRVPSLSLPVGEPTPESVLASEAGRLFVERAAAVRPGFAVTARNAPAVAQIGRRLDGIPLALELAAARVAALTAEEIAARLDDRLRLLTGGSRAAPPRQRTLRAAIDWSHDLLTGPERALLRRLAVFAGDWSLAAAEAVGAGEGVAPGSVLDALTGLVAKSLVLADAGGTGETRYRLLETVRQYAGEKLAEAAEEAAARDRHAAYFLAVAEWPPPVGPPGAEWNQEPPDQAGRRARLAREHDNLGAAMRRLIELGELARGLRLGVLLRLHWQSQGHREEGRAYLGELLRRAEGRDDLARERGWGGLNAGILARAQGAVAEAQAHHEASLALFRQLDDPYGIGHLLMNLGQVLQVRGEYAVARTRLTESVRLFEAIGDEHGLGHATMWLGVLAGDEGAFAEGRRWFEAARRRWRALGNDTFLGAASVRHGLMEYCAGDHARARAVLEEGLALLRGAGGRLGPARYSVWAALVETADGQHQAARARLIMNLDLLARAGDAVGLCEALEAAAQVEAAERRPDQALRFAGAADARREQLQIPLAASLRRRLDERLAAARRALGPRPAGAAWAAGRALSLEQAVAEALAGETSPAPGPDPEPPSTLDRREPDALTGREREIAALVARGLTNRQIAAELSLSHRTVGTHVAAILGKRGFATRAQIAAWAVEQGMVATPAG